MVGLTADLPPDGIRPGPQILRGIGQSLISRILTSILQFATLVVLARGLGPASLGTSQVLFVVFTYLVLLNDPGLTTFGIREQGRSSSQLATPGPLLGARLLLSLPLAIVATVIVVALSPGSGTNAPTAAVLVLGTFASTMSMRWLLLARHAFGVVAICELVAALLQFAGAVVVFAEGLGAIAGLTVLVGGPTLVATLTYIGAGVRGAIVRPVFTRDSLRMIQQALPLGVAAIATAVYYSADSLLLGLTRGSEEVGVYAAAYRIVLASLTLPVVVHGIALPVIAKTLDMDRAVAYRVVRGLSGWLMLIASPAAAAVAMLAAGLIDLVYGAPYAASALPLSVLVWSLVTVSANVPFAVLLLASRRDRAYLGVTILGAVVNVTLNLVAIPSYGYIGAAFTTLAAELVVLASFVWLTRPLSIAALRYSVPLGLVTALGVAVPVALWEGSLLSHLAIAAAGFGVAVLVLAWTGALRESLAMLDRSSP